MLGVKLISVAQRSPEDAGQRENTHATAETPTRLFLTKKQFLDPNQAPFDNRLGQKITRAGKSS